jgi:hypothetical protein
MKFRYNLILIIFFLGSCSEKEIPENDLKKRTPFKTTYKISELLYTDSFEAQPESKGKVLIEEASGLAESKRNPGHLWTIQDKGNSNILYLIDAGNGDLVAEYKILGTTNRDWESIEISGGPEAGKSYLYIGDTGDNDMVYEDYTIYRFEEPKFEENHRNQLIEIETQVDKVVFDFAKKSHDVETLLVDPFTNDIFLVTKRDLYSLLYTLPFPQSTAKKTSAVLSGTFSFRFATAGCVSEDGNEVMIKTYDRIFYWKRSSGQSFQDLLGTVPSLAPYEREAQGEAVCFSSSGGYYTLSEVADGIIPDLNFYRRK